MLLSACSALLTLLDGTVECLDKESEGFHVYKWPKIVGLFGSPVNILNSMVNIKGLINAGLIKMANITGALQIIKENIENDGKYDRFIDIVHRFIKGVKIYFENLNKIEENSYVPIYLSPQVIFLKFLAFNKVFILFLEAKSSFKKLG